MPRGGGCGGDDYVEGDGAEDSNSGESTEPDDDKNEKELFIERRWSSLMECCKGNFLGSIGWYDVVVTPAAAASDASTPAEAGSTANDIITTTTSTTTVDSATAVNKQYTFQARPENGKRNMRLSFTLRSSSSE